MLVIRTMSQDLGFMHLNPFQPVSASCLSQVIAGNMVLPCADAALPKWLYSGQALPGLPRLVRPSLRGAGWLTLLRMQQ